MHHNLQSVIAAIPGHTHVLNFFNENLNSINVCDSYISIGLVSDWITL